MNKRNSKKPDKAEVVSPEEQLRKSLLGEMKKFVRYDEGAELYSMGRNSFEKLAKEAKATYHYGRIVLVNTELVNEFMENFKDELDW